MKRILSITLGLLFMSTPFAHGQSDIKKPNVSGSFYHSDPKRLAGDVERFLNASRAVPRHPIEMVIAPHAGYIYSGSVAGHSFKAVSRYSYKTIVVIAPSHFYGFDGVSIWEKGGFETPLGVIPVDEEFTRNLVGANDQFYFEPQAFEREHALEVELPFLQKTFQNFKIVPIIMGQASLETCRALAETLDALIGERKDVLIVISTDLSHYHSDQAARAMDKKTLAAVQKLSVEDLWRESQAGTMELCGLVPVTTALYYARKRNLEPEILQYDTSARTSMDYGRVVGYGSVVFYAKENLAEGILSREQKQRLLKLAKSTVNTLVIAGEVFDFTETDPELQQDNGAFVTLHVQGKLRGCIGNIIGQGPVYRTIRDMAIAAASRDPRFEPISENELKDLEVEISVLSRPRRISDVSEIIMGTHGVIISRGPYHQGVFLPQVATETGWSREEFLSQLCSHKAGLPPDAWKDLSNVKIEIFTADVFSEKDF